MLTQDFSDPKAASALTLLNEFAERYANAELPACFYVVFCAVKLVAPIKKMPESEGGVPDVRPLGLGECLRRAINAALIAELKPACADFLSPQQVAIGNPSGISLVVFGVRALLELHPDWVVVRLDLWNAFNEIKRAIVMQRLQESEDLQCLVPLFWASHIGSSKIYLASDGLQEAPFSSEEGVQQGDGPSSAGFCVGIHPEM